MEVYVDNMLVKSKDEANHLDDLKESFSILRKYNMKLSPTKCVFAIALGKFLGFMVSQRGIEANPDKVKATDKCMPFFKVLKKAFQWTNECEKALAKLKKYLMKPPLLSPLVMGEKLYLYLAVSNTAVCLTLIREEENVQKLVYYTS